MERSSGWACRGLGGMQRCQLERPAKAAVEGTCMHADEGACTHKRCRTQLPHPVENPRDGWAQPGVALGQRRQLAKQVWSDSHHRQQAGLRASQH